MNPTSSGYPKTVLSIASLLGKDGESQWLAVISLPHTSNTVAAHWGVAFDTPSPAIAKPTCVFQAISSFSSLYNIIPCDS